MMIQKVALNSLKIGYVQVKTPKFSKPCSLACNCKIIWVSDSGQVGGLPRKFQSYPLGEAYRKIMLNFQNTIRGSLFLSRNCSKSSKASHARIISPHKRATLASKPSKGTRVDE